jgi:hypothetical protein
VRVRERLGAHKHHEKRLKQGFSLVRMRSGIVSIKETHKRARQTIGGKPT